MRGRGADSSLFSLAQLWFSGEWRTGTDVVYGGCEAATNRAGKGGTALLIFHLGRHLLDAEALKVAFSCCLF